MTPLAKAQQILDELVLYAGEQSVQVPALRYVQISTPVVAAEALTIALIDVSPHEQYGPTDCNASQLATYSIVLSRECSWTSDDTGVDDPAKVAAVSAMLSADGELLWGFGQQYAAYLSKQWNVTWQLTGALGISTMSFIVGVD